VPVFVPVLCVLSVINSIVDDARVRRQPAECADDALTFRSKSRIRRSASFSLSRPQCGVDLHLRARRHPDRGRSGHWATVSSPNDRGTGEETSPGTEQEPRSSAARAGVLNVTDGVHLGSPTHTRPQSDVSRIYQDAAHRRRKANRRPYSLFYLPDTRLLGPSTTTAPGSVPMAISSSPVGAMNIPKDSPDTGMVKVPVQFAFTA
jgi:hypothetical protein